MRVYRVHMSDDTGMSLGHAYFATLEEVEAHNDKLGEIYGPDSIRTTLHIHEVELTRTGMIKALNWFGSHADNG